MIIGMSYIFDLMKDPLLSTFKLSSNYLIANITYLLPNTRKYLALSKRTLQMFTGCL